MASSEEIQLDSRIFALFKGDPGSGKSIAAASFPNPYIIDNDRRMKSVVNYWRPRGKEFEYDHFDDFNSTNKRLEELYEYCPFETIIYDGITTGGDIILKTMVNTRDAKAKRNIRGGIELLQIEDYGGEDRGLTILIDNLKAISFKHNVHCIVTAHIITTEQRDIVSKVTNVSRTLLTAGKKVAARLPVHFDEAYHFDVQSSIDMSNPDPHYTCITRNVGQDWAKTALPLPIRIDFTNGSLYDEIMKSLREQGIVQAVNNPQVGDQIKKAGW